MVKATKHLTTGPSRIRLNHRFFKPNEVSLVIIRMKELDREFSRQTKHLTALTKRLRHKVSDHLLPPHDK